MIIVAIESNANRFFFIFIKKRLDKSYPFIYTKTLKLKINSRNKINTENPLTSIAREEYELTIKKNEFKDKLSNFKKNSFQDNISRAESNPKDIIFISSYGNNKKDNSE